MGGAGEAGRAGRRAGRDVWHRSGSPRVGVHGRPSVASRIRSAAAARPRTRLDHHQEDDRHEQHAQDHAAALDRGDRRPAAPAADRAAPGGGGAEVSSITRCDALALDEERVAERDEVQDDRDGEPPGRPTRQVDPARRGSAATPVIALEIAERIDEPVRRSSARPARRSCACCGSAPPIAPMTGRRTSARTRRSRPSTCRNSRYGNSRPGPSTPPLDGSGARRRGRIVARRHASDRRASDRRLRRPASSGDRRSRPGRTRPGAPGVA